MATKPSTDSLYHVDGSMDFSGGVDSNAVTTVASGLNPNGLKRQQLAWLNNATVRGGGILQRTGWQPLLKIIPAGRWQGGYLYEPDSANPYLICSISGHIYKVLVEPPFTVTELANTLVAPWTNYGTNNLVIDGNNVTLENPQFNPPDAEMAFFAQGENHLIIQAGDYGTTTTPTLPLFWDGTTLRRSIGITTFTPSGYKPGINEIPAATCMWYHAARMWYAQSRQVSAGDMAGGPSGTAPDHFRDAILSVTENPLVVGGDGFSLPTSAGNIRALRDEVNLNESVGQLRLLIWTRKMVFALTVPTTRTDWINASATNQPLMVPVQRVNGAVGDRCVVASNGDWFYQSFEPGIRSLITAVRYYDQWGNTPISQNEQRALQINDRSLMRFSGGIEFDNRMLQLALPVLAADGVNVVHQAILPLDFDIVTNLEQKKAPVWEGAYEGLKFLQPFTGDFGGLPRAFAVIIDDIDSSIAVWEFTTANRFENGDNRVTWAFESPSWTWSTSGLELRLKQLNGGELWVDKVFGTVDMDVFYREDADPCWRFWFHTEFCAARNCEEFESPCLNYPYPQSSFREGYVFPIVFPEPKPACDSMGVRPTTIGYQFQVKIIVKGWCRVRALLLHAMEKEKAQYQGVACPPTGGPQGMRKLPHVHTPLPPTPSILTITPTTLPNGTASVFYSQQLSGIGGFGPYTFTISSGALPSGLSLSSSGHIFGAPTVPGSGSFTVTVRDRIGNHGHQSYTITIPVSFTYSPAASTITWTDVHGAGQSGDLSRFLTLADIATVTDINLNNQGITAISNLSLLPALTTFAAVNNSLTAIDFTGCSLLTTINCSTNSIVSLDLSPCTALVSFDCNSNLLLSTLNMVGCLQITTLVANNCVLNSLQVNSLMFVIDNSFNVGTCNTSGQTPPAPPTAGSPNGIAHKNAAIINGWVVTTD